MVLSALKPFANCVTLLHILLGIISLLTIVERSYWLGTHTVKMQQIRFNYSLKNIGLPTHDEYRRNIIDKTESVIHRMRWKAHFFLHGDSKDAQKTNTYGLKSTRSPPHVPELKGFEDDVIKMISNTQFRDGSDEFTKSLDADKRKITSSNNLFVPADKTRNMYEMDAPAYTKLLTENVTKTYKLAQENSMNSINDELKHIADGLKISNRIEPMAQSKAFISLKDHKDNFENHPQCRLINPAKSNLGKVSKSILDRINTDIRNETRSNQWRNSDDTISWFTSIPNKNRHTFLSFDIVNFYPSISEQLLDDAINWSKQFTTISENDIKIIKHARKSLLFNNGKTWTKQNSLNSFDVTMGSYDGAEICELVGLFFLSTLENRFGNQIGLYRDDGLAAITTTSGRLADKARKDLIQIFANFGLKITADANLKRVNFLDITLDLTDGTYKPYRKPNDEPLYVNRLSNHPPSILRQLPLSINKRINKLSCDKQTFDAAAPPYNDALKHSNFDTNLTYEPPAQNGNDYPNYNQQRKRNRQRNAIWYNPPFSKNVQTNIGRDFLSLLDKHFPPSNKLYSIFNRHTVRVSYSCLPNMKSFISQHNNKILNQYTKQQTNTQNANECNCRRPDACPVEKKCLSESVVYQADVTTVDNNETKSYVGVTGGPFKNRYRNHTKSFSHRKYADETELSKFIWKLNDSKRAFKINWSLRKKVAAYKIGSRRCNLCLEEKLILLKDRKHELLNRRSELFSKCRHVTRHLVSSCK